MILRRKLIDQINGRCLVFTMCTNTIGSVLGYTAFLDNNIVQVLLNAGMDNELLCKLIETYHPSYIWMPVEKSAIFDTLEETYEVEEYVLLKTDFEECFPLYEKMGLLLTC